MNHKRDAVKRFISEQLPSFVAAELDSGPLAQQAQAEAQLNSPIAASMGRERHSGEARDRRERRVLAPAAPQFELPIGQEVPKAAQAAGR